MSAGRLTPARIISEAKVWRNRWGLAVFTPVVRRWYRNNERNPAGVGRRGRVLLEKQTERCSKSVAAPAADSDQVVASLPEPAGGIGSCYPCHARESALPRAEDRRDSDPRLLATGDPVGASIPRWPSPGSSESWTKIAPPRPPTVARWFVWES